MDLQELLAFLEIDEPSEFEYFENFADLAESDEAVPEETLFMLFSETDKKVVAEITGSYFDDMLEAIPDSAIDMYTLLDTVKMVLVGLISASDDDENVLTHFVEEFSRFRSWYCFESAVECREINGDEEKVLSLRDALTLARMEKLEGYEYDYDFSDCLNYELDEYMMTFADMAKEETPEEDDKENILDNGYVYDDEMKD